MSTESPHVHDQIEELLDGRLDHAARERVETHLAGCEDCERFRQALLRVRESLRAGLRRVEAPPDLRASVSTALDREVEQANESPRSKGRRFRLFAAAAAAVVLIALAVCLGRPRTCRRSSRMTIPNSAPASCRSSSRPQTPRRSKDSSPIAESNSARACSIWR